ncbi:hypothetical protein FIBSPDRAFT_888957 [Athelia psychrophila]|uniref:Uncharacterized protein n=1 Tax=Athelia psychrophila TaxID=1759441 RepID=A0A166MR56_9AGAM|nr:hypothetical protein FIBSPDRAFT_888957 [Fibularhizoctonia sp. CBS 109695]
MRGGSFRLTLFILALLGNAHAQVPHTFQWAFKDPVAALPNSTSMGVPPYYMIAYESGGIPTTTNIGTNATNLSWQAGYGIGTQLTLAMVDASGSSGGVPAYLYNVTAGQGSSCYSKRNTTLRIYANVTKDLQTCDPWGLQIVGGVPPYNITSTAPGSGTWTNISLPQGFDVFTYINRGSPGGYLIASVSDSTGQWGVSTALVNTAGGSDMTCEGLVSADHQSSNTPFYANGTTLNGTDTNGTQQPLTTQQPRPSPQTGMSSHKTTIIAVCAVLGALVVLGLSLFFCGRARKQRNSTNQDTVPRTFMPPLLLDGRPEPGAWGTDNYAQSSTAAMSSVPHVVGWKPSFSKVPLSDYNIHHLQHQYSDQTMSSHHTMRNPQGPRRQESGSSSNSIPHNILIPNRPGRELLPSPLESEPFPPSLFSFSQPPPSLPTEIDYPNTGNPTRFQYPPSTSSPSEYTRGPPSPPAVINRLSNPYPNETSQTLSAKQAEARLRHVRSSPNTRLPDAISPSSDARPQSHLGARQPNQTNVEGNIESEVIIQHRDGGTVTELPPPYMDRSST